MRCFVRLPSESRPKILMIPDHTCFEAFKAAACAKLGVICDCSVLLGSNAGIIKLDIDMAPQLEAMDEISPDDLIIIVPKGNTSETKAAVAEPEANHDGKAEPLEDEAEAEDEDEDEDDVIFVTEKSRQSTLDDSEARAHREGRFVELDAEESPATVGGGLASGSIACESLPPSKRAREPKPRLPRPVLEAVLDDVDATGPL